MCKELILENLENEVWKDIIGYEGYYQVSNMGRIRSLDRYIWQSKDNGNLYSRFMKGKVLSNKRTNGNGYCIVQLNTGTGSISKNNYIHILVASHFIDNENNFPQVNHKDGNKSNNQVSNLEWITNAGNVQHAIKNNLINSRYLNDEEIIEIYEYIINNPKDNYETVSNKFDVKKITVQNIKNKSTVRYKELLSNYETIYDTIRRRKYTDEEIINIYVLSNRDNYNDIEIAKIYNCPIPVVQEIRSRKINKTITEEISKQYPVKTPESGRSKPIKVFKDGIEVGIFKSITDFVNQIYEIFGFNATKDILRERIKNKKEYKGLIIEYI